MMRFINTPRRPLALDAPRGLRTLFGPAYAALGVWPALR